MSQDPAATADWLIQDTDYVQEAEQTVYNYNAISIENALVLNKQMRVYMNELKEDLERMLVECKQKYKQNERLLAQMSHQKSTPKLYTTYYFCGYPFFKNRQGGAPPKSAEYLTRSANGEEMFPLDLETHGIWLVRDKVELVQGVKKQVLEYFQTKNRIQIHKSKGKRTASEMSTRIENDSKALERMHLKDLLKRTEGTDFRINWQNISMDAMGDRHTPNECVAMWNGYLMPTLNRSPWTAAEEDKLLNAAIQFDGQDWSSISKELEHRSAYQCFVHYHARFEKNVQKNVRWTQEQDHKLVECVEKFRIGNIIPWTKVMEHCTDRTKSQVYNRYMFTLNPQINRAPFTIEEDCILMAAIKEYGTNYRDFPANLLPGRNMKQIYSRYNNVLKHVSVREHWTEEHDRKLVGLVELYGTAEWAKIADEMVSHSRTSCRQRYTTIQKFLDKFPTKSIADVPRRKRGFSTNVTTENWMKTILEARNSESAHTAASADDDGVEEIDKSKKKVIPAYNSDYYDFFKYSFGFKFGETPPGNDALFENVQIACQLLQAPTIPNRLPLDDDLISNYVTVPISLRKVQLEPDLLRSLIQLGNNDFSYPVNLNTVLGMRGLSIMFGGIEKKNAFNIKREPTLNDANALNLFKFRFNSIFKQSAMLAKLQRPMTSVALRLRRRSFAQASTSTSAGMYENVTASEDDESVAKRAKIEEMQIPQYNFYRYRVEPCPDIQHTDIEPCYSESEAETMPGEVSSTEFIIWTPTTTTDDTATAATSNTIFDQ